MREIVVHETHLSIFIYKSKTDVTGSGTDST